MIYRHFQRLALNRYCSFGFFLLFFCSFLFPDQCVTDMLGIQTHYGYLVTKCSYLLLYDIVIGQSLIATVTH